MAYEVTVRTRLDRETYNLLVDRTNKTGGNISEFIREQISRALEEDDHLTKQQRARFKARRQSQELKRIISNFKEVLDTWNRTWDLGLLKFLVQEAEQHPFLTLPPDVAQAERRYLKEKA